jgi:hypothetical protein
MVQGVSTVGWSGRSGRVWPEFWGASGGRSKRCGNPDKRSPQAQGHQSFNLADNQIVSTISGWTQVSGAVGSSRTRVWCTRMGPMIRRETGRGGNNLWLKSWPVEIGKCWRGQVRSPLNSPPSTLPLFSHNSLFSHRCTFQFFRIYVLPRRDKGTIQGFQGRFLA